MNVKLTWKVASTTARTKEPTFIELYVGVVPRPVATVMRSAGGKSYEVLMELPGARRLPRKWDTLDNQKVAVEASVRDWIARMQQMPLD